MLIEYMLWNLADNFDDPNLAWAGLCKFGPRYMWRTILSQSLTECGFLLTVSTVFQSVRFCLRDAKRR